MTAAALCGAGDAGSTPSNTAFDRAASPWQPSRLSARTPVAIAAAVEGGGWSWGTGEARGRLETSHLLRPLNPTCRMVGTPPPVPQTPPRSFTLAVAHSTRTTHTHLRDADGGKQQATIVECRDRRRSGSHGFGRNSRILTTQLETREQKREGKAGDGWATPQTQDPTQPPTPLDSHARHSQARPRASSRWRPHAHSTARAITSAPPADASRPPAMCAVGRGAPSPSPAGAVAAAAVARRSWSCGRTGQRGRRDEKHASADARHEQTHLPIG